MWEALKRTIDELLFWPDIWCKQLAMWWRRNPGVAGPARRGTERTDAVTPNRPDWKPVRNNELAFAVAVAGDGIKTGWRALARTAVAAKAWWVAGWKPLAPAAPEASPPDGPERPGGIQRWTRLLTREGRKEAALEELICRDRINSAWVYSEATHEEWLEMRDRWNAARARYYRFGDPRWKSRYTAEDIEKAMAVNDGSRDTAHFKARADRQGELAIIKKAGWMAGRDISARAYRGSLLSFYAEYGDDPLLMIPVQASDRDWRKHADEWWIDLIGNKRLSWAQIRTARETERRRVEQQEGE